jgi:hypothetical protein
MRPLFKPLIVVCLIVFNSFSSFCMDNEIDYFHDHEELIGQCAAINDDSSDTPPPQKKNARKSSSRGLYDRLEDKKNELEIRNIEKAFNNIDELFEKTEIKIQKLNEKDDPISLKISTLSHFLSGPHDKEEIINIIEKSLLISLKQSYVDIVYKEKTLSFHKAVNLLWKKNIISDKKARSIIIKNSIMNSKELIRLVENGATKTSSGYLIQLRTGNSYGDTLKLFEDVSTIINKLKENNNEEFGDLHLNIYNKKSISKQALKLLEEQGIKAQEILSDAHIIREMRRHFLFISRIGMPIRFRPGTADFNSTPANGGVSVDPNNYTNLIITPKSISALLIGNYYINSLNASMSHSLFVNPLGITYSGSLSFDGQGTDWWLSYSDGFLGGGSSYTVNFDQGTFWSNGQPSYLAMGLMVGGWRDYLMAGFSLSTVLANSIGIGINATMSISRNHDVSYLGQYPIDGKFSSIRGMHKIEINDLKGVQINGTFALNPAAAGIPLTVAFRASTEHTKRRIYRTHVPFDRAQSMLSEADIRGVLFLLGKKIKETRIPKFENPEILIDGDELVETKTGKLSGAFVIGLQSLVPVAASRIGGTIEITAEFELGLRKFPNEKYEISIEPRKVYEMGLFASILNVLGAGYIKSIAVARKQIFIFDFMQPEAKKAYFDLIHHGRLPTSEEIEIYTEDRGPEYLLTEFRAQNQSLKPRGIARTYLEKVSVETTKKHIGINAPLLPAILNVVNKIDKKARKSKDHVNLKFEGIDRDFIRSHAKSVATNGLISVRRHTFGGRRSEGQGFSGRYNQDLFVTHRRIHAIDDSSYEFAGNKWQFDSLIVHGQLEDTIITGNEENAMAEKINHLFSTFIGSFEYKNSKSPRIINIEREFSKRDLDDLTHKEARERIPVASQTTGIDQTKLMMLLKKLENKHPDHQGLMVKQFIEESTGLTGFAAIHQLLGARPEHLFIRTESGYTNAVMNAKKFIAIYSSSYDDKDRASTNLAALNLRKNRKRTRDFYIEAQNHLRELDTQLRLLYDDKYLIDDESPLVRIYGNKKISELVSAGVRQDKSSFKSSLVSARKVILELMDLEHQEFNQDERILIFRMAGKKYIGLKERVELLMHEYEKLPIKPEMTENYLRIRYRKCWEITAKIDKKINTLSNDNVMLIMDKEYINSSIDELLGLRKRVSNATSLDHLDQQEKQLLKNKIEHEENFLYKFFHRKKQKDLRIEGALARAFSEIPSRNNNQPSEDERHIPSEAASDESEIINSVDTDSSDESDSMSSLEDEETSPPKPTLQYVHSRKRIYAEPDT